jgi:hypothetical protein
MIDIFITHNKQDGFWYVGFTTTTKTYTVQVTACQKAAEKTALNLQSFLMNI